MTDDVWMDNLAEEFQDVIPYLTINEAGLLNMYYDEHDYESVYYLLQFFKKEIEMHRK